MLLLSASCTPCQEDALKDRSSMPPVSVTMHAVNAAAAGLPDPLGDAPPPELDLVLPQAAASSASTPSAAVARTVCLTVTSCFRGGCDRPHGPLAPFPARSLTRKIKNAPLWDVRRLD